MQLMNTHGPDPGHPFALLLLQLLVLLFPATDLFVDLALTVQAVQLSE